MSHYRTNIQVISVIPQKLVQLVRNLKCSPQRCHVVDLNASLAYLCTPRQRKSYLLLQGPCRCQGRAHVRALCYKQMARNKQNVAHGKSRPRLHVWFCDSMKAYEVPPPFLPFSSR
jgi:hypothetical protein